ncbi:hypothetical protein H0A36_09790 [Endozoicomonas sp. SM1973]|uniref:Uncharacterized protein n=1 Tax=Spartinivicinus marinus TaxID=2994442 RepID=A0A853I453_9GAMM|nr:hypothetical protein [Spartinivicinus marinus]MCX4024671.1 hypothetical protein [Spartinivicinus marinus]NYZ66302.1 hypothetical protein [Spartinivicinus marinus]
MNRFFEALVMLGLFYLCVVAIGIVALFFYLYGYYALLPAVGFVGVVYRLLKHSPSNDLHNVN